MALVTFTAHADIDPKAEYDKKIKAAQVVNVLGPNLAGDSTSLYTGSTSFSAVDVSLPGAVGPSVAVGRSFSVEVGRQEAQTGTATITRLRAFGDWDLDIPFLSGVYSNQLGWEIDSTTPTKRCSVLSQLRADGSAARGSPRNYPISFPQWWPSEFWSGVEINLPGAGKQALLVANVANVPKPTGGGPYHWNTKDDWWFSCLDNTTNAAGGEAFVGFSPNGDKYTFGHLTSRWVTALNERICTLDGVENPQPPFDGQCSTRRMTRKEYFLLPTRVEDRFGNWVDYAWSTDAFARLLSVTAKDGRQLTLSYNAAGYVGSISDGSHAWTYQYSGSSLTAVVLPDGTQWQYSFATITPTANPMSCQDIGEPINCYAPTVVSGTVGGYAIHPSGARVDFSFANHFKPTVNGMGSGGGSYPIALTSKTLSGPGITSATWTYGFLPTRDQFKATCASTGCPQQITTDATAPDGSIVRSSFGIVPTTNQGLLLSEQSGKLVSGAPVFSRTNTIAYASAAQYNGFVAQRGTNPMYQGDGLGDEAELFYSERKLPVNLRQVSQQGVQFAWQASTFDTYARPISVTRASTGNAGGDSLRNDQTTFLDNTAKWVVGQVLTTSCSGTTDCTPAKETSRVDYDATSLLPWKTYRFGILEKTLTYNADGTLASVKDGRNNVTTIGNWYRGAPRLITWPSLTLPAPTRSATVSPAGEILSTTDELGYTTGYGYDAMSRLSGITYPTGGPAWNGLTRPIIQVATAEYGLPAGHWRSSAQTGTGKIITYYDALWQPVLTLTEDTASVATRSFVVTRFDAMGRKVFSSYPVATLSTINDTLTGARTYYDELGRVTQTQQDSELVNGQVVLTTSSAYLSGFATQVTNLRGYVTTTKYQVFDSPSTDAPVRIDHPQGVTTLIARQPALGKPLTVTRQGTYLGSLLSAVRRYVYDSNERLCQTINPESGTTAVTYDAAGNIDWTADGQTASGTTATTCANDRTNTPVGVRTTRTYDPMNRLTSLVTPGGTANVTTTYEADGLVKSLVAANPGAFNVTTTYTYNNRRLLTGESSSFGAVLQPIAYGYNANAHLSTLTYPDNQIVGYSPDALGRATQVAVPGGQVYASGISYFPTGAIKSFTYGNGIIHTMTPNARQLPARSLDALGAAKTIDDNYLYDGNGNVLSVTDALPAGNTNRSRNLGYDGLDRMLSAGAPQQWVSASYTYDPLDNLRTADIGIPSVGTRQFRYNYDASNRLATIKNPAGALAYTFGYDLNGNTTAKTVGAGCASDATLQCASKPSQALMFDSANRLSQVTGVQSYRYDGTGRRVQTTDADGKTTFWLYSQSGQVLYTSEARRSQNLAYIYLGNTQVATRSQAWTVGTVAVQYQHTDALGSPVAQTNAAAAIIKRNSYSPWGEAWGATSIDGTGYTGHVMDQGTGLTYMQQRYYDPAIGRFLSVDPAESEFNRYNYASNNPYRFVDPDGRYSILSYPEEAEAKYEREGNDDAEIREQYRHDTGRGAHFANLFSQGSSQAADIVDEQVTDPKNLLYVVPFEKAIAQLVVLARISVVAKPIAQVTRNREAGNQFRDLLAGLLKDSGRTVRTEVYKKTPFGARFIDIQVEYNGKILGGIETKVGASRYTPLQRLKDWWLRNVEDYPVELVRSP